jgi:DNA repair exonuclease SbcCD ATPase subunit/predicted phosphodiesterase
MMAIHKKTNNETGIKIAVSSDFHLHDWIQYSDIDQFGRPSRLTQYIDLAMDFVHFAEKNHCDVAVIAGDILQQPLLKPMVIDVLGTVIRIITDKIPLIITFGQHDIDTKKAEISEFHSALRHLKDIKQENLYYAEKPTIFMINGYTFYVKPWQPEATLDHLIEADVFVGHGFVSGASNYEGYVFNSGFKKEELLNKFTLSIVGDIHKGQTFHSDGGDRLVLIPGACPQNSLKDSPVVGFWCIRITEDTDIGDYNFQSIHDLHPNFYHKFLYTDDPNDKSSKLVHYKLKPKKAKKEKNGSGNSTDRTATISEMICKIIDQAKIDDKDFVKEIALKELEAITSQDRSIPRSVIHKVKIHNFLSVSDFELDFDSFQDSVVITGANGAGKTSLFESIFWCLTGETTRGISVSELKNDNAQDGTVFVELLIEVEDTPYKIVRSRIDGKPNLHVIVWNNEMESAEIDKNSTAATQDTIRKLIGLSAEEILLLDYFSAKKPVLFGDMKGVAKNNLMAMVSSTDEVDKLRDRFSDRISVNEKESIRVKYAMEDIAHSISSLETRVKEYLAKKSEDVGNDLIDKLREGESEFVEKLESYPETEEELLDTKRQLEVSRSEADTKSASILLKVQAFNITNDNIQNSIMSVKRQMAKALEGTCPTCNQPVENEDIAWDLAKEIDMLEKGLISKEEIGKLTSESYELQKNTIEFSTAVNNIAEQIQEIRDIKDSLSVIKSELNKAQGSKVDYDALARAEIERMPELVNRNIIEEQKLKQLTRLDSAEGWIYSKLLKRNGPLILELNGQTKNLLQKEINDLTEDSGISIKIDDKLDLSASFLSRTHKNYDSLSTGQARLIDIVMMIALNNLFTDLYGLDQGVLGLVIFDEVMSFLDNEFIDFAHSLLEMSRTDKKLVITHDERMSSKFNNNIHVRLDPGNNDSQYTTSWS